MSSLMLYPYNLCLVKRKIACPRNDRKSARAASKNIPIQPQPEGFAIVVEFSVNPAARP